jgi:hypothetical protein
MPFLFLISTLILSSIFKPWAVFAAEDWDPFVNLEKDQQINSAVEDQDFKEESWPKKTVTWQEDKNGYTVSVEFNHIPKNKVDVVVKDNALVITTHEEQELTKVLRVPDDADLNRMSHRLADEHLVISLPKKRLKSII